MDEAERVRKRHTGWQNLLQNEDFLVLVFIAAPTWRHDDDAYQVTILLIKGTQPRRISKISFFARVLESGFRAAPIVVAGTRELCFCFDAVVAPCASSR
jgi:hypothetical protein